MLPHSRHTVFAERFAQFIGLMTHPGANDPNSRRGLCVELITDIYQLLGMIDAEYSVISREAFDEFNEEFTSGIRKILREFGIPEDDLPSWNELNPLL